MAFKYLLATASPAAGAGASPLVPPKPVSPTTVLSIAVISVDVKSIGFAVAAVLLPFKVLVAIVFSLVLVTALLAIVTAPVFDIVASALIGTPVEIFKALPTNMFADDNTLDSPLVI